MKQVTRIAVAAVVVGLACAAALADGMIVPVRPDIRVRGHWAVNYHRVKMTVRDQVASVTIDQEFVNTGEGMIEVEYLFPVPPRAAIDAMTLVVNGKEFTARLLKADEARKIYEDIVRRKKDPALLEYAGFGLYRTKAFPLEPGKPAKVVVHYDYICKKDRDLVEVWYPLNTEKFSARPIKDVKVVADIKSKADITAVYSPTHDLRVDRKDARHVIATYHATDTTPATDIQIFYNAANRDVGATLLTYRPDVKTDGYFLLLVSPNPRAAKQKVVPKDVAVVLDRSGSMSGEKIEQAAQAVRFILNNLNENDRFNVIAYSDTIDTFFDELTEVSKKNLDDARDQLDRISSGGGTNIHDALVTAMKMLRDNGEPKRPRYLIFLTDGLPTVGKTDEKTILKDTREANAAGVRLFAFGVGYDVNIRLLDKLVGENHGKSDYVKPAENIESKISSLYAKIRNPVMTDLKVRIEGVRLRDMYPRELGDLFEGDQILLAGRYLEKDSPASEGKKDTTLVVTGTYEGKERGFEYPVCLVKTAKANRFAFVERLWAVRRVGYLMDQIQLHGESKEVIDELVKLSKDYGIMTPYTSFLAEETTRLSSGVELRRRMEVAAKSMEADIVGGRGQRAAVARQSLRSVDKVSAPSAAPGGGVAMYGNIRKEAYEAGETETVTSIRQVGNQALYRRGKVWIAANASDTDLKRDTGKIKEIERFSDEYFRL
ncbi:MAG: VIT domain-containing protein, partial [Planctomycetota bacterium]